jgi:uncharacterized protein (TIGR00725 family)
MKCIQIAVIGSAGPEEYPFQKPDIKMLVTAEELGTLLAQAGCAVVNGGKGGVMNAVAKGAKQAGGLTIAEVSGLGRGTSNAYTDIEVVTGDIAFRGPSQLVTMSDAVISLGGGAGTLQEICVAYRMRKPIILLKGFGGWSDRLSKVKWLDERKLTAFEIVLSPKAAVAKALSLIQFNQGK